MESPDDQQPSVILITENTTLGEIEDLLSNYSALVEEPIELRMSYAGARWCAMLYVWDKPTTSREHNTLAESVNEVIPVPEEQP